MMYFTNMKIRKHHGTAVYSAHCKAVSCHSGQVFHSFVLKPTLFIFTVMMFSLSCKVHLSTTLLVVSATPTNFYKQQNTIGL